jgi:putative ATPase
MKQTDLFAQQIKKAPNKKPLADLLRPEKLEDFQGHLKLVGEGAPIKKMIEKDDLVSMIFWGPPGCGKTTLARIIAKETSSYFVQLSAVNAGKKDVNNVIQQAREIFQAYNGKRTVLFLDEIHRFNKAQQDFLLPYVEDGTIILIGATTENPSFEVNSALLSRMRVFVFERLTNEDVEKVINRAIDFIKIESKVEVNLQKKAIEILVSSANGDPRSALNILELAVKLAI